MKRCFPSLAAALLLLGVPPARAGTNTVTTLADDGPGSLRAAIANALPGDVITFATDGTLSLTIGELVLDKDLCILGLGQTNLVIDGNYNNRAFRIEGGVTVLLTDLTIVNGRTPSGSGGLYGNPPANHGGSSNPGGAIFNSGSLSMVGCSVKSSGTGNGGNGAEGGIRPPGKGGASGSGGAIYSTGSLNLTNCSFTANFTGYGGSGGGNGTTSAQGGGAGHGGAIYCAGPMTVESCTFAHNASGGAGYSGGFDSFGEVALAGDGGAIYALSTLVMSHCVLSNNATGQGGWRTDGGFATEGGKGGGLCALGESTVQNCNFLGNATGYGGSGGYFSQPAKGGSGGAVYGSTSLVLTGNTLARNLTGNGGYAYQSGFAGGNGGDGAGLHNAGNVVMTSCTLSGNATGTGGAGASADTGINGTGGGMFTSSFLAVNSCTISSNKLGTGAIGYRNSPRYGGGISASAGPLPQLWNTIVADNFGGYTTNYAFVTFPDDLSGSFTSHGHNLIGATDNNTDFPASGDLVGSRASPLSPALGALRNNGGPTLTHALLPGSPALDAGDDTVAAALSTDQRGSPRLSGPHVDIGAFEWLPPLLTEPGHTNGFFRFVLKGAAGNTYVIQVSSDFVLWQPILTNTMPANGHLPIFDPSLASLPMQFYRVVPQ